MQEGDCPEITVAGSYAVSVLTSYHAGLWYGGVDHAVAVDERGQVYRRHLLCCSDEHRL